METIYKMLLSVHIVCGFSALLAGLISIFSVKGKRTHRLSGKVFYYCMLAVAFTAVVISLYKKNQFLLLIGIFAFFQDYSGYRSVKNKSLKPGFMDWTVLLVAAVNSFFMLFSMNTVLMVFGGISTFMVIGDLRIFILTVREKAIPRVQWLIRHISMMLGAYISTATAFLVVNVKNVEPEWIPWLLPTFLITPLIIYWTRKYSVKSRQT